MTNSGCARVILCGMRKRSFLKDGETAVALLCRPTSVDHAVALSRAAYEDGADGVTIELNQFPLAARTVAGFPVMGEAIGATPQEAPSGEVGSR